MTLTPPSTGLQHPAVPAIAYPSNAADPDPGFPDISSLSIEDITAWATSLPPDTFTHLLRSLITQWTHHNPGGSATNLNRVLHELIAELNGSSPIPPKASEGWAIIPGDVAGSRTAIQVGSLRQYEATKVRKPRDSKKGKGKAAKAPKVTTYQYNEYSFCWQERDEHGRWRSFSCYVGGCPVGQHPKGAAADKIATIERQCANHRPYGETLVLIGKESRINSLEQGNRSYRQG
jgi:hypothetical protein